MFWKKKVKKLTEEELISNDDKELKNFDNTIKIVGKFVVYCLDDGTANGEYTIQDAIEAGAEIKKCKARKERQMGYKYIVSYGPAIDFFYDNNKAQQFLEKYLLLLSNNAK